PVLIMPNGTGTSVQQKMLERLAERHRRVRLLWRPVAAALAWLAERYDECDRWCQGQRTPMLVVYLGLDSFEVTSLTLIRDGSTGELRPARNRPQPHDACDSPGLAAVANVAVASLRNGIPPA